MPIFKRGSRQSHDSGLQPQIDTSETDVDIYEDELTPESFIDRHRESLTQSIDTWRDIAGSIDFSNDPNLVAAVWSNMNACMTPEYKRNYIGHDLTMRDASKLAAEFGLFSLVVARYDDRVSGKRTISNARTINQLQLNQNPYIEAVINKSFSSHFLGSHARNISISLDKADACSDSVLGDLVQTVRTQPDFLPSLADASVGAQGSIDSSSRELRNMIAVDWQHPEPTQSHLRNYVETIKSNPDHHLEGFVKKVESDQRNRRYALIRDMARFALDWEGVERPESVGSILRTSYPRWSTFEQISGAFDEYAKQQAREIEQAIVRLAGNNNGQLKLRAHRTVEDITSMSEYVTNTFLNRDDRRRRVDVRSKGIKPLPSAQDITNELASLEHEEDKPKDRKLYGAKRLARGGHELVEIEGKNLAEELGFDRFPKDIAEDIERMIATISEDPVGRGSKRIVGGHGSITLINGRSGKKVNLWRFSSMDYNAGGARVSEGSGQVRIVYGLLKDILIVADVLNHREFDKKYT